MMNIEWCDGSTSQKMKWFNREILPLRHQYNCQINDDVYPQPLGAIGKLLLKFHHERHGVPTSGFRSSERAIEIPLAIDFLSNHVGTEPVVELGCVLPYYILKRDNHISYDLADKHPQSIKKDIRRMSDDDLRGNVVSISTIEHIGMDEYGIETKGDASAVDVLRRIVANAKRYFITFPLGHNAELDEYILNNYGLGERYVTRMEQDPNTWIVVERSGLTDEMKRYGTYLRANTICVLLRA